MKSSAKWLKCIFPTAADKHLPPHGHPLYFWSKSQCVSLKGNLSCWSGRQAQERPLQCSTWQKWQVTHRKFTERVGVTLCIIVNFLLCSTACRTQTQSAQHEPTEWHSWPTWRVSRQVTRNMDSTNMVERYAKLLSLICFDWRYKPVDQKLILLPLREAFEDLFSQTYSRKQNLTFLGHVQTCFRGKRWQDLLKLMDHVCKSALTKELYDKSNGNTKSSNQLHHSFMFQISLYKTFINEVNKAF